MKTAALFAPLFLLAGTASADDEATPVEWGARLTPSGQYADPSSFFRLHGYVNLSFSVVGSELGSNGETPQILLPRVSPRTGNNEGGFFSDSAVFISGEPFDGVGSKIELHFVGNALSPVLTEAYGYLDVFEGSDKGKLRIVAGRFWSPFGAHFEEWFSAVNRFTPVSPAAAEVVPAHYNEVGVMAEGVGALSKTLALNFAVAVGNGVPGFEVSDAVQNTAFDYDGEPTIAGRFALVCMHGPLELRVGLSAAVGNLREGVDPMISESDPHRYGAAYGAGGLDVLASYHGAKLRGYALVSREDLDDAPADELDRWGVTVEPAYELPIGLRLLKSVELAGRFSSADEDRLDGSHVRWIQAGAAARLQIKRALQVRISYVKQIEKRDARDVDDDVFSVSATAEF